MDASALLVVLAFLGAAAAAAYLGHWEARRDIARRKQADR